MLIVNPNNRLQTSLAGIEPPLWASLCASYMDADILDAEALNLSLDQTEYEIKRRHPDKIIIVVMGNNPSVSSTPKMPISEELASRLPFNKVFLTGIHPLAIGSKYQLIFQPFQGTPDIDWSKLPMDKYRAHNWHCLSGVPRSPYASVYTSLGCPYSNCYYCNIKTLYPDKKFQLRPIPNVIKEIDTLVTRYHVKNIKFWDELFAFKEDRVLEICKGLESYDLNIWAYARLDTITEQMLKAMKRGGIQWLAYGFESVKDKKFISRTEDVIKMTKDAGISIIANFMFGLPGTTEDDDKASVEFAMKHLFEFVNFYTAYPYPGSAWYNDWVKTNPQNIDFNQYHNISPFRKKAFNDYFTNPEYLSMLKAKWGQQAVKQIEFMLENQF